MEPPQYNGKETITQYLRRAKEYEIYLKMEKYNLILEFINKLLNSSYTSILQLKNIEESKIVSNKKILKTYVPKLASLCNFDTEITTNIDTDEVPEDETITYLRKMLISIEYILVKKNNKYFIMSK